MLDFLDRKIAPMLAVPGRSFDSTDYLFEIKWDGIRALAFFDRERARLQGRGLGDSTHRYPEIASALRRLPGEAILDGEIVVLEGEKPSFESVLERELIDHPAKVAMRSRRQPALYVAFDLLYLNGKELLSIALSERKRLLSQLLTPHPPTPIIESAYVVGRGKDYFREAARRGLEGIMAKRLDSPYVPGARANSWVKIKTRRTLDAVVLGLVLERGTHRVKSLVLGSYLEGRVVWLGNVGSGLGAETLHRLAERLEPLDADPPPNLKVIAPGEIRWLKPVLVARVHYQEITREGRLRAPVFAGFVDSRPESCRLRLDLG
jgi:DNA ligase D-like protein (predicted ligase)